MKCAICEKEKECKDILKDTFTDLDLLKGRMICKECEYLFDTEWLKTGFYWTKIEKKKCKQKDFENIILKPEFPCLISFSKSRKKHRLFRSRWSYNNNEIYISTDYGDEILNKKDIEFFKYLSEFYKNNKISKDWIINEFPTNVIKKIGIQNYFKFQKKLKRYKNTTKLILLVDFLNKTPFN